MSGTGTVGDAPGMQLVTPGLYLISDGADDADWVYFLLASDASPAASPLTLGDSWSHESGWYLFCTEEVEAGDVAAQFVVQAREALAPVLTGGTLAIAWLTSVHDPAAQASLTIQRPIPSVFSVTSGSGLAATRISLALHTDTSGSAAIALLEPSADQPVPAFCVSTDPSYTQSITLDYDGVQQVVGYPDNGWSIALALDGPSKGSLVFSLALDPGTLYETFGCAIQFAGGPSGAWECSFPLFPPASPGGAQEDLAAFLLALHPTRPFDAHATRLQIDRAGRLGGATPSARCTRQVQNAKGLVSTAFFANDGDIVSLTPWDPDEQLLASPDASPPSPDDIVGGGFAFSRQVCGGSPPQRPCHATNGGSPGQESYLSPVGGFRVGLGGSPGSTDDAVSMMPGLFAREYLRLAPGDGLVFLNDKPALAPSFQAPDGDQSAVDSPLVDGATTSWPAVWLTGASSARAYYAQPSAASFFGPPAASAEESTAGSLGIGTSIDIMLSPLHDSVPFPMVPYGALRSQPESPGTASPTSFSSTLQEFEGSILSQVRQQALLDAPRGAIATPIGSLTPSPRLKAITTPTGVLIDLGSDGSWSGITLAVGSGASPLADNALRFLPNADGLIAPSLSTLLTRNQLFLVMTSDAAAKAWNFQDRIAVGGFEFNISFTEGDEPAILIVKHDTRRSLEELALDPASWAPSSPPAFADPTAIVQRLTQAFEFAENFDDQQGDPFADFNQLRKDPLWTGILVFGAPINGNGMPADFQMLLGGIPGLLRAHHVGIQMNKLQVADAGTSFSIEQSSVFGVVAYERDVESPPVAGPNANANNEPEYDVDVMIAVLSNSALTQLNVKVSLVLHSLFGRAVKLTPEPTSPHVPHDAVSIQGQYQRHGDTGRVTFTTQQPFRFVFPTPQGEVRIIESVVFTGASLVPVSGSGGGSPALTNGSPAADWIAADFTLEGQILFAEEPFAGVPLDLFSYGSDAGEGLAFSDLTTRIRFELDADGAVLPASRTVAWVPDSMRAQASPAAIRPHSLLGSLPLKLSKFLTTEGDSNASIGAGAQTVNVLQLTPGGGKSSPASPGSNSTRAPAVSAGVTGSPTYALEYTVSLGSLGTLSSAHGDISASLILGWGPSPSVPDNDAAAVMIQLPSLSAGYKGFELQGILKTKFGEANLLRVPLDPGGAVYALLLGNIQLSVFGFTFPPGVLVDFLLFAGQPDSGTTDTSNIAWLLAATTDKHGGAA